MVLCRPSLPGRCGGRELIVFQKGLLAGSGRLSNYRLREPKIHTVTLVTALRTYLLSPPDPPSTVLGFRD